jgi:outer membrane biosynthesis protein TonB
MPAIALRSEERLGLGIAVAAHLALIAALVVTAARKPEMIKLPERMVVSLAQDVSLTSTAPQPAKEAQAAIAETLTEKPTPKPVEKPPEVKKPEPAKVPPVVKRAAPPDKPKPQPKPQPKADKSGGSLIGKNFLQGLGDSTASNKPAAAAAFGAAEAASLNAAISRQIRPHWSAPQGVDADKLVTLVRFRLNSDGTLAGDPACVGQSGVTPSNAAQKLLHCERAIRAVRLAAPFDLPDQFYDKWKLITSRFDRRL